MPNSSVFRFRSLMVLAGLLLIATVDLGAAQRDKNPATLNTPANRNARRIEALKEEVRHQLVTLPYYTVFDWLEAQVKPDGTVTLMGEVTRPTVKDDAEHRVKKLEAVSRAINNIEVLPLSPMDDELRVALYRAIYRFDSPLFRYGTRSVPPIHIIVKNGHVTLKGIVLNEGDSQLAYMAARGVPGTFEVKNELQIEQRVEEKAAKK
jgi:hyperosmotically inducible periplasmic protein